MENFNLKMEKEISLIKLNSVKPKLLLHCCCAPCTSGCIERLMDFFDITFYYYNPNIDTLGEYDLRADELKKLAKKFNLKYIIEKYNSQEFLDIAKGYESLPEGSERCFKCFELRLNKSAKFCKENAFEYFTTTLTISPLKNASKLNEIGEMLGAKYNVKFLNSDFKKKGGYLRSIQMSREMDFYRQNYCGCAFSKRDSLIKKDW